MIESINALPERDLERVLARTRSLWPTLKGARLFFTGGTGFVGRWLLETFTRANDRLRLGASAWVLTRDPRSFGQRAPHLAAHPAIQLIAGDVRRVAFPPGSFARVVHAAAPASAAFNRHHPAVMFDTIVEGTHRTLNFARRAGAQRVLLVSSGAVYGPQPASLAHLAEDRTSGPDPLFPDSAYAEGKRVAEMIAGWYVREGLHVTIARPFAFVGPLLPLDRHFAAGNFIRDALAGGPVRITSDGMAVRSYLYAADLAVWLWTILERGVPGRPYNVGSDVPVTIRSLAERVARAVDPPVDIHIAGSGEVSSADRYVPCIARARRELGLTPTISIGQAIGRTLAWTRTCAGSPDNTPTITSLQTGAS